MYSSPIDYVSLCGAYFWVYVCVYAPMCMCVCLGMGVPLL